MLGWYREDVVQDKRLPASCNPRVLLVIGKVRSGSAELPSWRWCFFFKFCIYIPQRSTKAVGHSSAAESNRELPRIRRLRRERPNPNVPNTLHYSSQAALLLYPHRLRASMLGRIQVLSSSSQLDTSSTLPTSTHAPSTVAAEDDDKH